MLAPESKTRSGIVLRGISPGGLNPAPAGPAIPTVELSAVGICLPAERLRMHEQSRSALWVLSDVAKTKDGCLTSTQSIAYTSDNSMARLHTETIPTSTLAATARVVDGFVTTQTDHSGITGSFTRAYTVTGVTLTATDGRGNTMTTHTDLAGRSISSTDAAGNTTTTVYDEDFDQPSVITNAQGKTACYKYDLRGRKVAEWGTAIQSPRRLVGGLDKRAAFARRARSRGAAPSQPALFGYDDADNLTALTTFRADSGDITTDPTGRTDGDTTTWVYHPAAGVELSKTYADSTQVVKTYDALIRRRLTAPSQVFSSGGTILTAYTYSPYGAVTATGNATQHIQWSSEYNDSELGLVYYNYRHYNPADGRWLSRDKQGEHADPNLYILVGNSTICNTDQRGEWFFVAAAIMVTMGTASLVYEIYKALDGLAENVHESKKKGKKRDDIQELLDYRERMSDACQNSASLIQSTPGTTVTGPATSPTPLDAIDYVETAVDVVKAVKK